MTQRQRPWFPNDAETRRLALSLELGSLRGPAPMATWIWACLFGRCVAHVAPELRVLGL